MAPMVRSPVDFHEPVIAYASIGQYIKLNARHIIVLTSVRLCESGIVHPTYNKH